MQSVSVRRYLSVASAWEITIKYSKGKLGLPQLPEIFIEEQLNALGVTLLPVRLSHLGLLSSLPFHHRDSFDRLLIAQSIAENIPIVSADATFDNYSDLVRQW